MLGFDWRSYHQIFGRKKRTLSEFQTEFRSTPYFITYSKGIIVSAYHESVNLSEWVGAPVLEFYEKFDHQEIIALQNSDVNQWVKQSMQDGHYYSQLGSIKSSAMSALKSQPKGSKFSKELKWSVYKKNQNSVKYLDNAHFLFEGIETWWKKLIPQYFMLFIRVSKENEAADDLLLEFQNGEWVGCEVPDLSLLGSEKYLDRYAVSKTLKDQFKVSCLVVETNESSWYELIQSPDPWRVLFTKIRKKEILFTHSRFKWWALTGLRAYFGV